MKLTAEVPVQFDDHVQEVNRRNVNARITELQKAVQPIAGVSFLRLLHVPRILTLATGSGALSPGTCVVMGWSLGAGGGGGGAGAGGGTASGAGGGSGILLRWIIGTPGTPLANLNYTFACGAGGVGGSSAGGNGGNGGDATFTINGITVIAKGGGGGDGMTSAVNATSFGGLGLAGSSLALGYGASARGEDGIVDASVGFSGMGASIPPYGTGGGPGRTSVGGDAIAFGAGGGGANATAAGFAGGSGGAAFHEIWEFC